MNVLAPLPTPTSASGRFYTLCVTVLGASGKRHQSSYRRTRRRLNIKPDPHFLPSKTEPHDHIIHNPPPSMPNVYHTPTIFLPKDDKRRVLHANLSNPVLGNPNISQSPTGQLPPALKEPAPPKYHLTQPDLEEMRRLRREDPIKWSVVKLAKKFECSKLFVMSVTLGCAPGKKEMQKMVTDAVRSNWGVKRTAAREDRALRKEQWFRDA